MAGTLPSSSEELTNEPAVIRKDNDGCHMSGRTATAASIRQRREWTSARLITGLMVVSNWLVSLVTKWCGGFTTAIHLAGEKSSRSYLFRMWPPCYMRFIICRLLVHRKWFPGVSKYTVRRVVHHPKSQSCQRFECVAAVHRQGWRSLNFVSTSFSITIGVKGCWGRWKVVPSTL